MNADAYIDVGAFVICVCGKTMKANNVADDMSDTSIRVSHELADELFDRKKRGESYEDVIWRLIEEAEGNND